MTNRFRHDRRRVLAFVATNALAVGCAAAPRSPIPPNPSPSRTDPREPAADARLAAIERRFRGRLGVHAVDVGSGATASRRSDERFLLCSTSKAPTVAAVLRRAVDEPGLLERHVRWAPDQVVGRQSPVGRSRQTVGATVAELCDAAITVSDNTAQNLLLELLGEPPAMTTFMRGLGDPVTRFDRYEPELNVSGPGDERDTTTPALIARDLQALTLGDALPAAARDRLVALMVANTTGDEQIRAGVPVGWRVADKTGSGARGEANDIGIVWPPGRAPLVVAVYTEPFDGTNALGREVIADATRAVVDALVPGG